MRRSLLPIVAALLAGCGSSDTLPAPEAPPATGAQGARLDTSARTLTVGTQTVGAGVGPAAVAETDERVYVADAVQHALLVFEKRPELHLQRRAYLPGEPASVAVDEDGVVVGLAGGDDVELTLGGVERER